jgi:hypothetical protein
MKRFFTFGCSFTQHSWPMWPYFFVNNFDQILNFAKGGAGNDYIFHSAIDAINRFNITSDDVVVVMWSSYYRRDILREYQWETRGGVANYLTPEQVDLVWSLKHSVVTTWNYIYTLAEILKSKNIKFVFASMESLDNKFIPDYFKTLRESEVFCEDNVISYTVKNFPKYHSIPWTTTNSSTDIIRQDSHPKILVSHNFAKNIIGKKLEIEVDPLFEIGATELHDILNKKIIDFSVAGPHNALTVKGYGHCQVNLISKDWLPGWIDLANKFKDKE